MSLFLRFPRFVGELPCFPEWKAIGVPLKRCCSNASAAEVDQEKKEEFRVLRIRPRKTNASSSPTKRVRPEEPIPDVKYTKETDWSNVWVGPKSFDPHIVPLPVRQGYNEGGDVPDKYANAELMKIPNFLHLTPVAVEKHCKALKQFCTKWPENLRTEKDINKHFPVTVIVSDYCHSSPTIRDPLSRIVTIKVPVSQLNLDKHAKDKFLRLVGHRYNKETGVLTLTAKNCPLRKQNYDHAMYILTALCYESWKTEDWESLKSNDDAEEYIFEQRLAKQNLEAYFAYNNQQVRDTGKVAEILKECQDKEETSDLVKSLKNEVLDLLGLPKFMSA